MDGGDAGAGAVDLGGEQRFEFENALCEVDALGFGRGGSGEVGSGAADVQGHWANRAGAGWGGGQFVADASEFVLDQVLGDGQAGLFILQTFAEFLGRLHAELSGVRR